MEQVYRLRSKSHARYFLWMHFKGNGHTPYPARFIFPKRRR